MKLGILVVYLVAEDDERLLDIHLSQIEKHTSVPYYIYASTNRLSPRFRAKLDRLPYVKICATQDTVLRGGEEHAYYLDRLAEAAATDDVTHLCTLHLDSFPIRDGWAEEAAAGLSGKCVLSGVQRDAQTDWKPATEFMLFTREFYLQYRPTFRIAAEVAESEAYKQYSAACPHTPDSGVGYGFAIWAAGLSWLPILPVDRARNLYYSGGIYGDVVFHLGGAVFYRAKRKPAKPGEMRLAAMLSVLRSTVIKIIPWRIRRRILPVLGLDSWMQTHFTVPALQATRSALLADPERFLRRLEDRP